MKKISISRNELVKNFHIYENIDKYLQFNSLHGSGTS